MLPAVRRRHRGDAIPTVGYFRLGYARPGVEACMQRVGVMVHPTRPVQDALRVLRRWVDARGLELVQIPSGDQPLVAPWGDVSACDLITALGGDGTILKALHVAAKTTTPVMGVAYGSVGA